jgi:hypothetical protein
MVIRERGIDITKKLEQDREIIRERLQIHDLTGGWGERERKRG